MSSSVSSPPPRLISDQLWALVEPLIPPRRPAIHGRTGRPQTGSSPPRCDSTPTWPSGSRAGGWKRRRSPPTARTSGSTSTPDSGRRRCPGSPGRRWTCRCASWRPPGVRTAEEGCPLARWATSTGGLGAARPRQGDHHAHRLPARPPRHGSAGRRALRRPAAGLGSLRSIRLVSRGVVDLEATPPRASHLQRHRGGAVSEGGLEPPRPIKGTSTSS